MCIEAISLAVDWSWIGIKLGADWQWCCHSVSRCRSPKMRGPQVSDCRESRNEPSGAFWLKIFAYTLSDQWYGPECTDTDLAQSWASTSWPPFPRIPIQFANWHSRRNTKSTKVKTKFQWWFTQCTCLFQTSIQAFEFAFITVELNVW